MLSKLPCTYQVTEINKYIIPDLVTENINDVIGVCVITILLLHVTQNIVIHPLDEIVHTFETRYILTLIPNKLNA